MGGTRILTDEQVETMIELREGGATLPQIQRRFAATGTVVSIGSIAWQCLRVGADLPATKRHVAGNPLPYRRGGRAVRPFTGEDDRILRELDHRGERVSVIARRLNRRPNSIRGRLLTLARHEARAEEHL